MKTTKLATILSVLFVMFFAIAFLSFASDLPKNYKEGEALVKYKRSAPKASMRAIAERHYMQTIRVFERLGIEHVKIPEGINLHDFISALKNEADVEYAEPNYTREPLEVLPNDPEWPQQWGFSKISMPDVWKITQGSAETIVATIDTGVDFNHPDIAENIWKNPGETGDNLKDDDGNGKIDDVYGWDFYNNKNYPMDFRGHGTHVAGIIGAVGNNAKGITGANWKVRIMPLKFMEETGDVASEIKAIDYAVKMGAKIINASYGDSSFSLSEYDAIKDAGDKGLLFIAAAGNKGSNNDGSTKNYPASYSLPNIISVAATDSNDNLASFSNYGATSVHLAAPGSNIRSLIPQGRSLTPGASVMYDTTKFSAYGMEFAGHTTGITKVLYNCGFGANPEDFPTDVQNNIALIQRGSEDGSQLTFKQKVINAQNAGAVAAIIYNNNATEPGSMYEGTLGEAGNWIPVVSISLNDGNVLRFQGNPTVTVVNYPYANLSGTSMATPFVSGVAALLLSERPNATVEQLKKAIVTSIDPIGSLTGKIASGGRLNAYRALQSIIEEIPEKTELSAGWNFVSFPMLPVEGKVTTVFRDVSPNVRIIWGYDNRNKKWLQYRPSAMSNELSAIESGNGYWVYMDAPGSIDMSGWSKVEQSVTLYPGWNLIGYNGNDGIRTVDALADIGEEWNIIWGWQNGTWYAKLNPSLNYSPAQPLDSLKKGRAYWIKILEGKSLLSWQQ